MRVANNRSPPRKTEPLQVKHLGVDEISLRKGQGDYVLVLTDLERRIVLDILSDRRKPTLVAWLESPPPGIKLPQLETVAIDLWSHYRDAVAQVYPNVQVVLNMTSIM